MDRKTATISRALRRGVTLDIDRLRSFWQVERPNLNGESFFFWQLSVLRNACLYFILTSLCLVLSFNLLFLTSGLLRLHHHVCLPCPTCQGFPRGAFGGDYLKILFSPPSPTPNQQKPYAFWAWRYLVFCLWIFILLLSWYPNDRPESLDLSSFSFSIFFFFSLTLFV